MPQTFPILVNLLCSLSQWLYDDKNFIQKVVITFCPNVTNASTQFYWLIRNCLRKSYLAIIYAYYPFTNKSNKANYRYLAIS